jgi:hypothetical protein
VFAGAFGGAYRFASTKAVLGHGRLMEAHIELHNHGQTAFASKVGCSEKTLRNFRRTGKVRRSILVEIAQAMGTTPEELLKPE